MTSFSFWVDEAPRPKPRARVTKHGAYTPGDYKAYEIRIASAAYLAMIAAGYEMFEGPVSIAYEFYLAANRGDLDNFIKGVQDGMNKMVFKDDRQVQMITAFKLHRKFAPGIRVTVTALPVDWHTAPK